MELARQCILRRARGHEQRGSGHVRDCYPGWANGHQRDYRAQPGLIASMRKSVFFRQERERDDQRSSPTRSQGKGMTASGRHYRGCERDDQRSSPTRSQGKGMTASGRHYRRPRRDDQRSSPTRSLGKGMTASGRHYRVSGFRRRRGLRAVRSAGTAGPAPRCRRVRRRRATASAGRTGCHAPGRWHRHGCGAGSTRPGRAR